MYPTKIVPGALHVLGALVMVYLIYRLGVTGALFYDDYGNLEGLAKISTWDDARQFILGGIAGPLGRPVALLTFLSHAEGWPGNSDAILLVNVWIHLANAVLLGILGYLLLAVADHRSSSDRYKIAFCAALLWTVMPLLASTTLIAIQRMTGLAALFGLLGLVGFAWGYRYQATRPWFALIFQMCTLGFGTLLAILSKENGALIPLYALLIDAVIVKTSPALTHRAMRVRRFMLLMGLLSILLYLSPLARDYAAVSDIRGYSVWDRLQTQVVVLWEYLRAAFIPLPSLYGPFHDHRGADYRGLVSAVALFSWAVLVFACALFRKKWTAWPLFAVLWYLVGHLIESTSIMLEIYFEHRNYLPIYGFCIAASVLVFRLAEKFKILALSLFAAYIGIQMLVLAAVTSVWGDPKLSAEAWAQENPASSRAALHLVFHDLGQGDAEATANLNEKFIARQRYEYALEVLDRTINSCDDCLGVRLQSVVYSCLLSDQEEVKRRISDIKNVAVTGKGTRAVVDTLFRLRDLRNSDACESLSRDDLVEVISQLASNHLFQINHILTRLYFIAAAIEEDRGNTAARDRYLYLAEQASPVALPVLQYQVVTASDSRDLNKARAAIQRRYQHVGGHSGAMNKEVLDAMMSEIDEVSSTP